MQAKITKTLVDKTEASTREVWVWDTEIRGFGLRVRPTGRKSYVVEYRPGAGGRNAPKRRYTIGTHGSPWTPTAARKRAIEVLAEVVKGNDPSADRQSSRNDDAETVAHFIGHFIERYAKHHQKSWRETERTLQKDVAPRIGKKRLLDVTKRDVAVLIDAMTERAPVGAQRTFSHTRRFFNWCVEQGFLQSNPCAGMKPPAGTSVRERVLSDSEVAAIWSATGSLPLLWECAFRVLLLTAQRKNEVLSMEWSEIDRNMRLWKIPGEKTKNGRAHEVPLSELLFEVLGKIPRIGDSRYVFTTNGKTPLASQSKIKRRLDALSSSIHSQHNDHEENNQPIPHWTIHDLRRTATTGMARLGIAPHVADALLNHKSGSLSGVAAVYNRYGYLDERRRALKMWEEHVISL
ncbi:tyrosine-type recombinase/integrase [Cognatishimia sp. D5M38]|uniref:Tyrosine-type recombinase/integrase n=1 Tax=Cognatishimia coralii TaxID=3083254 RepID=A0ABU8QHM8_9RHOB